MSKVSTEMKILRTTKKGTIAEMKNAFDVITSKLDTAEEKHL